MGLRTGMTDASNNTQVTYTQTPNVYGDLVSQQRSTTTKYYHFDALGSTVALPLQLFLFQYLAYYTAIRLGYDPDRPKNLTYYVRIEVSEP